MVPQETDMLEAQWFTTREVNGHRSEERVIPLKDDGVFVDVEFCEYPRECVTLMLDEIQQELREVGDE